MAEVKSVQKKDSGVSMTLNLTPEEYGLIKGSQDKVLLFPASEDVLDQELTTGKLGNGNRLMLPNRFLEGHAVTSLLKKVDSTIVSVSGSKYLISRLQNDKPGVPRYSK